MSIEQPKFETWEKEKMERREGIIKMLKKLEQKELSEETRKELDRAELKDILEIFKTEEGKFYSNLSEGVKKAVKEALGEKIKEKVGDYITEKVKTNEGLEKLKKEMGWFFSSGKSLGEK